MSLVFLFTLFISTWANAPPLPGFTWCWIWNGSGTSSTRSMDLRVSNPLWKLSSSTTNPWRFGRLCKGRQRNSCSDKMVERLLPMLLGGSYSCGPTCRVRRWRSRRALFNKSRNGCTKEKVSFQIRSAPFTLYQGKT